MIYTEIDIKKELPPNTEELFIVRYTDEYFYSTFLTVDELSGTEINNVYKYIAYWLKPTKESNTT